MVRRGRAPRRPRRRRRAERPGTARHRASRRPPTPVRGAQLTEIGNTSAQRWRDNWRVVAAGRRRARRRSALACARAARALARRRATCPPARRSSCRHRRPAAARRCRAFAAAAGIELEREFLAFPSAAAPAYLVEDAPAPVRLFVATVLVAPPRQPSLAPVRAHARAWCDVCAPGDSCGCSLLAASSSGGEREHGFGRARRVSARGRRRAARRRPLGVRRGQRACRRSSSARPRIRTPSSRCCSSRRRATRRHSPSRPPRPTAPRRPSTPRCAC